MPRCGRSGDQDARPEMTDCANTPATALPTPGAQPRGWSSLLDFVRLTITATDSAVVPQSVAHITRATNRETASATTAHTNCQTVAYTLPDTTSESNRHTDSTTIPRSNPQTTQATTCATCRQTMAEPISATVTKTVPGTVPLTITQTGATTRYGNFEEAT